MVEQTVGVDRRQVDKAVVEDRRNDPVCPNCGNEDLKWDLEQFMCPECGEMFFA